MWTKGMIMVASGIAGIVLTIVCIIILSVVSKRKKTGASVDGKTASAPGASLQEDKPRFSVQAANGGATGYMNKRVSTTVILDNETYSPGVKDTELLEKQTGK